MAEIFRVQKGIQKKVSPAKGVLCVYKKLDGGTTLYTGFICSLHFFISHKDPPHFLRLHSILLLFSCFHSFSITNKILYYLFNNNNNKGGKGRKKTIY